MKYVLNSGFNPTLVRLARMGTLPDEELRIPGFNPTLVRLALATAQETLYLLSRFNPTLVRLAHMKEDAASSAHSRFNPTLVRLAQLEYRVAAMLRRGFQSHLGSISTARHDLAPARAHTVSIPPWFD